MCGIFGFVDWRDPLPPVQDLARLTNLLRHRGPDGGAYWNEPGVFLGHRRLAIIDLTTGDQPMISGDGRYVITFNGEIYNYPELREELRGRGAAFRSASDTEVILEGYRVWGPDVVARLEGMFAFAIWDRLRQSLILARDRFGEKPLLVASSRGHVLFASELAPLAASGVVGHELDIEALGGYLCLNYVPGTKTLIRGIERLPPATWEIRSADGVVQRQRYWTPPVEVRGTSPTSQYRSSSNDTRTTDDELLDELQTRIDDAVRLTLRSDVPVGLFLSGGTDSAIVAQSAARQGRLEAAFCVDFAEQRFSEWPHASHVARRVGVEITRVPLDASVLQRFTDVAAHLDDPLADSSAMAVWTVAEAAARRLKVVLSGDGGDELFAGYLTYSASRYHRALTPWLPRAARAAIASIGRYIPVNDNVKVGADYKLKRLLRALPLDTREAHFTWNGTWLPGDAARLVRVDIAREAARSALKRLASSLELGGKLSLHDLQLADIREYLPNDILAKVDRATMAHGLESRAPLLNGRVAELALSLPDRLRGSMGGRTKILLRRLCERHFGAEHAHAPKQGFSIPLHRWLRREGRSLLTTLLAPERVEALGVLDASAITHAVTAHLSGRATLGWELWGLMVLVSWYEQRIASVPQVWALPAADLRAVAVA